MLVLSKVFLNKIFSSFFFTKYSQPQDCLVMADYFFSFKDLNILVFVPQYNEWHALNILSDID